MPSSFLVLCALVKCVHFSRCIMVTAAVMGKVTLSWAVEGSFFPAPVLLYCLLLPPPQLCHLARSFVLLVGSDLRTGFSEGIMEE
jgi:hypothetical protein